MQIQLTFFATFFFFYTNSLLATEFIRFHVTTIEGIPISNVRIRISEDPKQVTKTTMDDGFCIIKLEGLEELNDISIIVFKNGWTVVRPKQGNCFSVDYRDKSKVIAIQMQQNEEIYQLSKNLMPQSSLIQNANALTDYNNTVIPNYSKEFSYKVQIKASSSQIEPQIIEMWEQKLALKIYLQYITGSFYPYKYRIELGLIDREPAKHLLFTIQSAGFKDAFLVQDY